MPARKPVQNRFCVPDPQRTRRGPRRAGHTVWTPALRAWVKSSEIRRPSKKAPAGPSTRFRPKLMGRAWVLRARNPHHVAGAGLRYRIRNARRPRIAFQAPFSSHPQSASRSSNTRASACSAIKNRPVGEKMSMHESEGGLEKPLRSADSNWFPEEHGGQRKKPKCRQGPSVTLTDDDHCSIIASNGTVRHCFPPPAPDCIAGGRAKARNRCRRRQVLWRGTGIQTSRWRWTQNVGPIASTTGLPVESSQASANIFKLSPCAA